MGEVTAYHFDGSNRAEIIVVAPEKISYDFDMPHMNVKGETENFRLHPGEWLLITSKGNLIGMNHEEFVSSHSDYKPERKVSVKKPVKKVGKKK